MVGEDNLSDARILIVDDQRSIVTLLQVMLEVAGYRNVVGVTDPREVVSRFRELDPDLILLDLHMPVIDGVDVMRLLKEHVPDDSYLPILMLTADPTAQAKHRALEAGAKDFLTKPFDDEEVIQRIHNLLETRMLHVRLQAQNAVLDERVRERTRELEQAESEILLRLARAAEYRDDKTGEHTQRVGRLAAMLAKALGLSDQQAELIGTSAPLHDVGKIATPDAILRKPGALTEDEFEIVKTHTTIGARVFKGSTFALVQLAREIALSHHERWDGEGYPRGLAGEEIPLPARIVAVADTFDALCHERPYKASWPVEEALGEIEREKGKQFDPGVAEAFLRSQEEARIVRLDPERARHTSRSKKHPAEQPRP